MNSVQSTSALQKRQSSQIKKCILNGRTVYEKQYVTDDWGGDESVIRLRASREVGLLEQLHQSGVFGSRLGIVRVAEADPDNARIATEEVRGASLEQWIHSDAFNRSQLLPWYLAGRWIQSFQKIPLPQGDANAFAEQDQGGLVDYCDVRLKSLNELGYTWPDTRQRTELLKKIEEWFPHDYTKVWVHADYSPGNLMWGDGVLTPIDFAMARSGHTLEDVTYLIHRLEMANLYRPWMRLPIQQYRRAILRGLGQPTAECSGPYLAMMTKHLICRLHTYVRRPAKNLKQALHDRWVRRCLQFKLSRIAKLTS